MKIKTVLAIAVLIIGTSMALAQVPNVEKKDSKPQRDRTVFAHAGQARLNCPETIVVGVIDTPAGWNDYSRRVVPFEKLTIVNTAQGSRISCNYDQGRYAVDRLVPGRVCTPDGAANSPHISCRAIPTKK